MNLKKVTKIIINIICVLLFIILVLVIYAKVKVTFTSDKANANYFGYRIFEIASGSMEPTLKINDVVIIKVSKNNIKENDVIAYIDSNDAVITHRVLRVDGDNLVVKGDANNTTDSPITRSQVIGKMVKAYPKLGVWKRILTEPKTLILIFITFIFFDAALSYDSKKKDKKVKETEEPVETKEIPKEEVIEKGDKELLDFTRKIDVNEINSLLDKGKKKEKDKNADKDKDEIEVLTDDEEYTVRLDLDEIHRNIEHMNK